MKPTDVQVINNLLAIVWQDGHESFYDFEYLRRNCPCAACKGETVGPLHFRPPEPLYREESFQLESLDTVGAYAVRPLWKDGHGSGMYAFEYLRRICPCDSCSCAAK